MKMSDLLGDDWEDFFNLDDFYSDLFEYSIYYVEGE